MQGGTDRSWAKPFNPNPGPGQPHGSHRGHMSACNITNPRPGMHYAYAHRGEMYRGFTRQMILQGYKPVERSSGGPSTGSDLPPEFGSPQDNLVSVGNLVLMEIPLERYRTLEAEANAYRERVINGPTDRFLEQNATFQDQMPGGHRIQPLFAEREHGRNGYERKPLGE